MIVKTGIATWRSTSVGETPMWNVCYYDDCACASGAVQVGAARRRPSSLRGQWWMVTPVTAKVISGNVSAELDFIVAVVDFTR
jgi:hypothetical protein